MNFKVFQREDLDWLIIFINYSASVVGILVHFIIGFPWLWSLIVGYF